MTQVNAKVHLSDRRQLMNVGEMFSYAKMITDTGCT